MATSRNTFKMWKEHIFQNNYKVVYDEFQSHINKIWSSEEEITLASNCLIAINMNASNAIKGNNQNRENINELFNLAELCCNIISKSWECDGNNFLASLFNICKYLLSMNLTREVLILGQYSFEYADSKKLPKLEEKEERSAKAIIQELLRYINIANLTSETVKNFIDIWAFIFSPVGRVVKKLHITMILDVLNAYICKVNCISPYGDHNIVILGFLTDVIESTDVKDSTFCQIMTSFRLMINSSSNPHVKELIESIVIWIAKLSNSNRLLTPICEFLLYVLSICKSSAFVPNFGEKYKKIFDDISLEKGSSVNNATYFAAIAMINSRNLWYTNQDFRNISGVENLLELLLTMAERIGLLNENKLITTMKGRDYVCETYLIDYILCAIHRMDIQEPSRLKEFYPIAKRATQLCSKVCLDYDSTEKQRTFLLHLIGTDLVNLLRAYSKTELYVEAKELSLIALQSIMKLPSSDILNNAAFQVCVERLVVYLSNSYRFLNQFDEVLSTACFWSVKSPSSQKTLMNLFASVKAKILLSSDHKYLDTTCYDILKQQNCATWKRINLEPFDINSLLKLELECYSENHVTSPRLIEKILSLAKEQDFLTRVTLFILATRLYTESSECLESATNSLPEIDRFIGELKRKCASAERINVEKKTVFSCLLGNLFYMKFRIKLLSARCENEKEVIRLDSVKVPVSAIELGMEKESRDVSHVIHKYLLYKSQVEMTHLLDTAVEYWQKVINGNKMDSKLAEKLKNLSIFAFVKESAQIYRLYSHEAKEATSWKLLYSLSVACDDINNSVEAYTYLLSLSEEINSEWESEVIEKLSKVDELVRIRYQVEYAYRALQSGDVEKGLVLLKQINEENIKNKHQILWARFSYVSSQYEQAGFHSSIYGPVLTILECKYALTSLVKNSRWTQFSELCECQSLLLDMNLFIGYANLRTYQVHDAKAYLDEYISLIQKLGLPLRICHFLIAICELNVITCDVEECYVKLDALKEVLRFDNEKSEPSLVRKIVKEEVIPNLELNSEVRFISDFNSEDNFSSPVLETGLKFEMPDFLDHQTRCSCIFCVDSEFQRISCEVMSLYGAYFHRAGKPGMASKYFKNALEMANILYSRWKDLGKIDSYKFLDLVVMTKKRQNDFWASCEDYKKAVEGNEEALNEIKKLNVPNVALHWDLMDQSVILKYFENNPAAAKSRIDNSKNCQRETKRNGLKLLKRNYKTPVSKVSIKIYEDDDDEVSSLINKVDITPIPQRSRRVLFQNDSDFVVPKNPSSSTRPKRSTKKKQETPPEIVMRVPSSLARSSRKKETK